jgi:membrane-associated phospholipid phosphatase
MEIRDLHPEATSGEVGSRASARAATRATWVNLRPADLLAITVPFIFGLLVVTNAPHVHHWRPIAASLFGVALGGFACRVWATNSSRPIAQVFGNFYCMVSIYVSYSRLNPLIDLVSPVPFDRELQAIDYRLFGVQPSVWLERFHHPWLTELLFICYSAFFVWQLSLGVILYLRNNNDFADYFLTVVLFYMLSYVGYVLVPAIGPRFDLAESYSVPLRGVWLGDTIKDSFLNMPMLRDCFPSGHTGLTLLVLTRAWTKKAYGFFAIMLPFAMLLVFSTVYGRFHYVTDLLCALPFVVGILCLDACLRQLLPRGLSLTLPLRRSGLPSLARS